MLKIQASNMRYRFGPMHIETINAIIKLAMFYYAHCMWDDAEKYYRKVPVWYLEIDLKCKGNLAHSLYQKGKYDEAEEHYTDLVKLHVKKLGPDHNDTLEALNNLQTCIICQQKESVHRHKDVVNSLRWIVIKFLENLGEHDGRTIHAMNNLAVVLAKEPTTSRCAEDLFRKAIVAGEHVWGSNHPNTLSMVADLEYLLASKP